MKLKYITLSLIITFLLVSNYVTAINMIVNNVTGTGYNSSTVSGLKDIRDKLTNLISQYNYTVPISYDEFLMCELSNNNIFRYVNPPKLTVEKILDRVYKLGNYSVMFTNGNNSMNRICVFLSLSESTRTEINNVTYTQNSYTYFILYSPYVIISSDYLLRFSNIKIVVDNKEYSISEVLSSNVLKYDSNVYYNGSRFNVIVKGKKNKYIYYIRKRYGSEVFSGFIVKTSLTGYDVSIFDFVNVSMNPRISKKRTGLYFNKKEEMYFRSTGKSVYSIIDSTDVGNCFVINKTIIVYVPFNHINDVSLVISSGDKIISHISVLENDGYSIIVIKPNIKLFDVPLFVTFRVNQTLHNVYIGVLRV